MSGIDPGRFFESYHQGIIPTQAKLYDKLESLGYEVDGKRILSTRTVGVPITVMLLLMHDAYQNIVGQQKGMMSHKSQLGQETTSQMVKNTSLTLIKSLSVDGNEVNFDMLRTTSEISMNSSGSTQNTAAVMYTPETELANPLTTYFASNDVDVLVSSQTILVPDKTAKPRPNIDFFRPLFSFIEFTYAVGERIEYEVKQFHQVHNFRVILPQRGSNFESMSARRTALTHEGNIRVKIDPADSSIKLGGQKMDQAMKETFDEVGTWVEKTYTSMYDVLN